MATNGQPAALFHWTLDENDGTVAHEVQGLASGILQGNAQWDPEGGHHSGAVRFDGVDGRIILGPCDVMSATGAFSFSTWVKPDFVTAMERTIGVKTIGPGTDETIWSLSFINASALRFRLRAGSVIQELSTPPSSIFSGTWYHVVATYDGSAMRIYLNGSLMAEQGVTGTMGYHPQAPTTIAAQSNAQHPFSGWVDDVRIYEQGLTDQDVIDILLGNELSTSIHDHAPFFTSDRRAFLPAGAWSHWRLLDPSGREVRSARHQATFGTIDLEGLAAGHYLLCLQGGDRSSTWPLVVP